MVPDRLTFFFDNGQMYGTAYEALMELERTLNAQFNRSALPVSVIFIPVRRDQALQMLADGRGDIAIGRIAVTPDTRRRVEFTVPAVDSAKAVLVSGPSAPSVQRVEDLAGKEVHVVAGTQLELAEGLQKRLESQGLPRVRVRVADDNLRVDDLLEMVHAGLYPMAAVEAHVAQIWKAVWKDLEVHQNLVLAEAPLAWAVRKDAPRLLAALNEFVTARKVGTAYGSTVVRRYYSNPKWVRQATAPEDLTRFRQMVELFRKYATQFDFPHLLITAQAYQESRLNQNLRSSAGAVGVMQIKPSTAASKQVGVTPVTTLENNIKAGVKYLRYISDHYFAREPMDSVNRTLFCMASYNAGPNRIAQLRREAQEAGFDPNVWFNNVEIIAAKRIGRETTHYVANIYKYFLAYQEIVAAEAARKGAPASKL